MAVTDRVPVPAGLRDRADRFRRRPAREIDIAVAVVVSAATVAPTLVPVSQAWWIVALALLASAPVLWRRRAPMRIGLVVGVAMTALVIWHKPVLPYGPLVCVYTIAALSPPLLRMLSIPVIGVTVYVSLVLPDEQLEVYRAVGTAFAAAYALGTSARARRARAAELAERTRRLAQERATAAARERTRIARDMHDILTHSVGLMVVQAEAGPVVMRSDRRCAEAAFDAIAETGRGALTQLRGLLGTLRSEESAGGEPQPSLDAVPHLVERTARACLEVTLTSAGEPRAVAATSMWRRIESSRRH
ncbi:sensor histidine kinase [Actinomadura sp. HBU206391]|uniref:sensor histidine kinase n=1 Tax=Actinomadura sp. HBU206391 TaxID=2731692 RepID=UPI00165040BC|nr:histidine kinase dimerization/phosphoacceptor domain-containing protein [Actinomadura sp. HBU206391]MBC6459611.1 histidine kinase [Actinomadura sp. HBU206391]